MGAIIVPAFEPDKYLVKLVYHLSAKTEYDIIVVNDGSPELFDYFFRRIQRNAVVLNHASHLGRGAAIKTALQYIQTALPHQQEIVLIDTNRQCSLDQIHHMIKCIPHAPETLLLGSCCNNKVDSMYKRAACWLSKVYLRLHCKVHLTDVGTDFWGIHASQIPFLLKINGTGLDYRKNVIRAYAKTHKPIIEIPLHDESAFFTSMKPPSQLNNNCH